jgi:hypothetical protein
MKDRQPPLYLITGIIIGLLIGLFVSFVLLPVQYTDTSPDTLSEEQKDVYRALAARAYLYDADQARAFSRIALLGDANVGDALVTQAQQMVAGDGDVQAARGLALLASVLTNPETFITPLASIQIIQTTPTSSTQDMEITDTPVPASPTPFMTYTPRPTSTPQPTQGAPYQMVGDPSNICDPGDATSLLMVYVYDTEGNGVSGVKIQISVSDGGSSDFYTGLYPEINRGYADYEMAAGNTYSLRVGDGGEIIPGLSIPQCEKSDGSTYPGSLEIKFKQP